MDTIILLWTRSCYCFSHLKFVTLFQGSFLLLEYHSATLIKPQSHPVLTKTHSEEITVLQDSLPNPQSDILIVAESSLTDLLLLKFKSPNTRLILGYSDQSRAELGIFRTPLIIYQISNLNTSSTFIMHNLITQNRSLLSLR